MLAWLLKQHLYVEGSKDVLAYLVILSLVNCKSWEFETGCA